jgi:hypothetical protein
MWYSHKTTGELFGSGYQYRLDRESSGLFGLWNARAVFSPRHLFLGEVRGFMSQGYTLSVGLALVLQGYPLVVLAPAGLLLMVRRRLRPALFLAAWLAVFWGIYLCYRTIRADSFQFMCRKLLPALAPLAIGAAVALGQMPRRVRYATFAVVTLVSLGVATDFFVKFLAAERGMPPGPPGMGPPGGPPGPMRRPAFGPPDQQLRAAAERLKDDPRAASQALHGVVEFLGNVPPMAPAEVRQGAAKLLPRVQAIEAELRKAADSGKPLAAERQKALRDELLKLEPELRDVLPPRLEGPPEEGWKGPPQPGEKTPFGPAGERPDQIVLRLHTLIDEARRLGKDVSKAEELDRASKEAADRGDWQENRRLLLEAVRSVERALGRTETRPRSGPPPRPEDRQGGSW